MTVSLWKLSLVVIEIHAVVLFPQYCYGFWLRRLTPCCFGRQRKDMNTRVNKYAIASAIFMLISEKGKNHLEQSYRAIRSRDALLSDIAIGGFLKCE